MSNHGRDWLGSIIGILVFLVGISLLGLTFKLAYDMFSIPPSQAMGLTAGSTATLAKTGTSFATVLIRIFLLIVMALMGSWISNRGIAFYASSRAHPPQPPKQD